MHKLMSLLCVLTASMSLSIVQAAEIDVGTRNDGAPYVQIDAMGIPGGFDMDIIQAIAEDQKLDLHVHVHDFGELLPGIDSGKFDLVIGAITITDERKQSYDFSDPYVQDYVGVLTTDPSLKVSSVEEVAQQRIVLEKGTTYAKAFVEFGAEPILVDSHFTGIKEVAQGKADVFVSDEFMIAHAISAYDQIDFNLKRLPTKGFIPDNNLGIVVKKGNQELLDKINQGLANIRANGTYDEILTKWNMK